MTHFRVKNYENFQHYKSGKHNTGKPSWIKLYVSILTDYELTGLPDAAVGQLVRIWVLASQMDNKMPWDSKWIAQRIGASGAVNLELLEKQGFIERLDRADDESRQESRPTLDRCDESHSPLISSSLISSSEETKAEDSPLTPEDLMEGWNDICAPAGLSAVRELSESRRKQIRLRLKEHPETQFWQTVMDNIRGSPFLLGVNDRKWRVTFDWLFENDTNALKVFEGRYVADEKVSNPYGARRAG